MYRSKFRDPLLAIMSTNASAADIIEASKPKSPLDWVSLIVLLDQIPRNCFRGADAGIAYDFFDPRALGTALQAIKAGVPEHSQVRYRQGYRFWFYMPLEHSERIDMQEMAAMEHEKMFTDSRNLIDGLIDAEDTDGLYYRDILLRRRKQFETWVGTLRGMDEQHKGLLDRFGRFPRRDQALGRQSTQEEREYLRGMEGY